MDASEISFWLYIFTPSFLAATFIFIFRHQLNYALPADLKWVNLAFLIWLVSIGMAIGRNGQFFIEHHEQVRNIGFVVIALIGMPFLYWRSVVAQKTLETFSANSLTTTYAQATEQLGAYNSKGEPTVETRLGALYALEKIGKNNKDYREQIISLLTSYVREQTRRTNEDDHPIYWSAYAARYEIVPREDVQAVFNIFGATMSDWIKSTLGSNGLLDFQGCFLGGVRFNPRRQRCSFAEL